MPILIEVKPDAVRTTRPNAQNKTFRVLTVYAHCLKPTGERQPYPVEAAIFLNDGEQPPAPGNYTLAPASIYVKDGRLALAPKLVPAQR